jgi:adenine-specific DNA methylase
MKMTHKITNITNTPFENIHIKKIIENEIRALNETHGLNKTIKICDPFAREGFVGKLPNCISNDLNPEFDTDYNLEFKDFARVMNMHNQEFDLLVFDPPYSLRQLKEQYDGIGKDLKLWQTHNMWGVGKNLITENMPVGSVTISLGWTTAGFGKKRGFQKKAIHVFEQAAREDRYSLFVVVEEKVQYSLKHFEEE